MTLDEFVATELPGLSRFATAMCGGRDEAQDVLQEVLVRCHRNWAQVQRADRPTAYVRRMIVNEFISSRRKWARISPVDQVPVPAASDHGGPVADRLALLGELRRLPRQQRVVLALRYYAGLPDAAIAEHLGCTAGTVRGYAARALAALRIELSDADLFLTMEA